MTIINNYLTIYGDKQDIKKCVDTINTSLQIPLPDTPSKNNEWEILKWKTTQKLIIVSYEEKTNYLHFTSLNKPPLTWLNELANQYKGLFLNLVTTSDCKSYQTYQFQYQGNDKDEEIKDKEFQYHHLIGHPFG